MRRRHFLADIGGALLAGMAVGSIAGTAASARGADAEQGGAPHGVTLFLCGDVMTGRGIDQILPHPSAPQLFEPYVRSAQDYVTLAERANGPIDRAVDAGYVWGDARAELDRVRPDVRIVNLETAVTTSDDAWPRKGIHYRMHPGNVGCLTAAGIDCCVLANNHVMDWGRAGLAETLDILRGAGLRTAGAGRSVEEAAAPAAIDLRVGGRVLVFALAAEDSGVPGAWAATRGGGGINLLPDLSQRSADGVARQIAAHRRPGDLVVASLHWGGNWGYGIAPSQRAFAHRLIDAAGVDVVHGHSSHHPKGIEVHRGRPIVYGCGDFLNDYEGIHGHEDYRGELGLMYFVALDPTDGRLLRFEMSPTRIRRFRIERAERDDARWLQQTLDREGSRLGTRVELFDDGRLALRWDGAPPHV